MRLKELRIKANLRQSDLAKELGIALSAYSRYEHEERFPPVETLMFLGKKYGVSLEYLLEMPESGSTAIPDDELALLDAYRKADSNAKEDALLLLERHRDTGDKN